MQALYPIDKCLAVTPSDTVDLPGGICRGLWVGTTGNVKIIDPQGTTITLTGAVAGVIHWIRAKRVFTTDTTAGSIVALY